MFVFKQFPLIMIRRSKCFLCVEFLRSRDSFSPHFMNIVVEDKVSGGWWLCVSMGMLSEKM